MAVTASLVANFAALLTGAAGGLGTASVRHPLEKTISFTDGTGAAQVNKIWTRSAQSLAASTSDSWDLSGSLTDSLGTTVVFTKMKLIYIFAAAANVNNVVLGNDTNHVPIFGAVTHSVAVLPGNVLCLTNNSAAGWTVTAGTGDIIKITNSGAGTAVVYDIAILGS
jgi:hypothetical protein